MKKLNFKRIQSQYPDALKLTVRLKPKAAPLSEKVLKSIIGGGLTLYFRTSSTSQTIVCSVQAWREGLSLPKVYIVHGPQGSGKSTKANQLLDHYERKYVETIAFKPLLEDGHQISNVAAKSLIIDEVPADADFTSLSGPFYHAEQEVPLHWIVGIVQGTPVKGREFYPEIIFIDMEKEGPNDLPF